LKRKRKGRDWEFVGLALKYFEAKKARRAEKVIAKLNKQFMKLRRSDTTAFTPALPAGRLSGFWC
jgi:hypothetical protein